MSEYFKNSKLFTSFDRIANNADLVYKHIDRWLVNDRNRHVY